MVEEYAINNFLEELGLNETQSIIYRYMLFCKPSTIKDIKRELGLSYAQVNNNLNELENLGLINSTDSKPKQYYKINPKICLNQLIDAKLNDYNKFLDNIEDQIKISESQNGICTKTIYHYHYNDLNLAVEKLYELIKNAEKEIVISTLPPHVLKRIEPFLREAFKRGVKMSFYFSNLDYQLSLNYLDEITEIFKKLRITLIETKEKLSHEVIYNNIIVNNGHILIDDGYFNSISFKENEFYFAEGFYGTAIVQQMKNMFKIKTQKKRLEIKYPKYYQRVIDIIKERKMIKTRDISIETGISGKRLNEILKFLKKEGTVKETIDYAGVGRPGIYYSLGVSE